MDSEKLISLGLSHWEKKNAKGQCWWKGDLVALKDTPRFSCIAGFLEKNYFPGTKESTKVDAPQIYTL